MAKTSFIDTTYADITKYESALRTANRYFSARIVKKNKLLSAERKAEIKARSYLSILKEIWATYTETQKNNWKVAGTAMGKTGWQAFVQDTSIRIRAMLEGEATPSAYHNGYTGSVVMLENSTHYRITQIHPTTYYIKRKVSNKKSMYRILKVSEPVTLPFLLGVSYKSNLTATSENYLASFYAIVRSHYQGLDIDTAHTINFNLQQSWTRAEETLTTVLGVIRSYTLYIELFNVEGILYFDNLKSYHTGQNWVRDPACNFIEQAFTKQYSEVPKHWQEDILDPLAFHASAYEDI